jgi:hypothetical protein
VDLMSIGEFARLAQIQLILSLEPEAAAAQVGAYWSGAEADHAARRDLAGYLADRLTGNRNAMHEVRVRDIPARSLLCLLRHATLRTEPAHQEACIHLGQDPLTAAQSQLVSDSARACTGLA